MKKLMCCMVLLILPGCVTPDPPEQTAMGRDAGQLTDAADLHGEHVDTILDNATHIYKESKEPDSVERAGTIIDSTTRIKELEQLLREEALVKAQYVGELHELREHNATLMDEISSGNAKKYVWLRMLGALVFAGGIVGFFILKDIMMLGVSVGGVSLAAATFIFKFIEQYSTYLGIVVVVGIGWAIYRSLRLQNTTAHRAVEFGEILKQRLRDLGDVEFLKDLTGDNVVPGKLGKTHRVVEKQILSARKKIHKSAHPVAPRTVAKTS